jgi:thymidine phosphorylase
MDARAIIATLRRREIPDGASLRWFAAGLADGSVSDAQAGAFAMAVCLQGLDAQARATLTLAMRDTGSVLNWDLPGPVVDKHSTGGVGDCVSLVLAPALAACGAYVPMISGRGLGHSGGTLDKLEAIPGVQTAVSQQKFQSMVADLGCAIVSATGDIAPADARLYAIRDVTATVESIDLITASILSKKLAASPQGLVLDVKVGSGAFMKSIDDARTLATALSDTANAAGCVTSALITDMSQPLAPSLGNALEIAQVMQVLTDGVTNVPLAELAIALGAELMAHNNLAHDITDAKAQLTTAITSGRAAEIFAKMLTEMGGSPAFGDSWARLLPKAPIITDVVATNDGYVTTMNGEALGLAVVALGGGRQRDGDEIDPAVGLSDVLPIGTKVNKGDPLARIHANRADSAARAQSQVSQAILLGNTAPQSPPWIHERID